MKNHTEGKFDFGRILVKTWIDFCIERTLLVPWNSLFLIILQIPIIFFYLNLKKKRKRSSSGGMRRQQNLFLKFKIRWNMEAKSTILCHTPKGKLSNKNWWTNPSRNQLSKSSLKSTRSAKSYLFQRKLLSQLVTKVTKHPGLTPQSGAAFFICLLGERVVKCGRVEDF